MFTLLLIIFCNLTASNLSYMFVDLDVNNQIVLIKTKEELIKYAEAILFKKYGKEKIISEKPYIINLKKGIWTMKGTSIPENNKGGTFLIIVSARDGTIRKLTHYK